MSIYWNPWKSSSKSASNDSAVSALSISAADISSLDNDYLLLKRV